MTNLDFQLREFHDAFGHYRSDGPPAVPPEDVVRLRARLIIEEACEALDAIFVGRGQHHRNLSEIQAELMQFCDSAAIGIDMIALADALGDTDYVVEGTRLAFGIDGEPIAEAIHAANMAKFGGGKDEHGKSVKPPGWQPADVAGELRKQGWTG